MAAEYALTLEACPEAGFIGSSVELPTVFADGRTANECVRKVREALTATLVTMVERGKRPPAPSREGKREAQINIRCTPREKLLLTKAAKGSGFRSVSDYIRAKVLASVMAV